jgi:hypothetical protein
MDYHFVLSIFHILIVVPLFLFIGFKRASTPDWLYMSILTVGTVVLLYHGFKLIMRIRNHSGYVWVNAIHIALVAPLLIYIGYHKRNTPRFAYEVLLMLGFAAAGYHIFSLVKMLEAHPEKEKN